MNVKISHDVSFSAVVVDGARIFPNSYKLKINMITMTDDNNHQNVAIQRILVFIQEIFNRSVLCHVNNPNVSKITKIAKDSRVILLPEEPYDQIIAMILFHKLHSIVEENFEIDTLIISSDISPNLQYTIEEFEYFEYEDKKIELPWWQRPDPSTTDNPKLFKKSARWSDMNLSWNKNDQESIDLIFHPEYDNTEQDIVVLDGGGSNEKNTNV